jgi:hypothetical protein
MLGKRKIMGENAGRLTLWDIIRYWVFERCLAYCVKCWYPELTPEDILFLPSNEFIGLEREEYYKIKEALGDKSNLLPIPEWEKEILMEVTPLENGWVKYKRVED